MECKWKRNWNVENVRNHQANCRDFYICGMEDKMCRSCREQGYGEDVKTTEADFKAHSEGRLPKPCPRTQVIRVDKVGYCLGCGNNTRLYHWGNYYDLCECDE